MKELNKGFVEMIEQMTDLEGGRSLEQLIDSLRGDQPSIGVRVNRRKGIAIPENSRPVPWNENGFYPGGERPRFTFDPALHQGLYYVQDPSSMSIGHIIGNLTSGSGPIVYIDSCAAPGGKTTAAIDALPEGSLVIANEWDRRRADTLKENIIKWGYPAVVVSRGGTAPFRRLRDIADIIAVDAPCSGEGMMRKDDDAVGQWSAELTKSCAALQREIVADMWTALRPGGYLIYSTCTFNRLENELNVQWMIDELGAENLAAPLPESVGIAGAIGSRIHASRFIPGRTEGEGLFLALLRKPSDRRAELHPDNNDRRRPRHIGKDSDTTPPSQISQWIKRDGMYVSSGGNTVTAFPAKWRKELGMLLKELDIIYHGIEIATLKGRDYIPSQALALSESLNPDTFASAEINYTQAIAYLRHETISLGNDTPRGIILLTYRGHPLGFVKNLGNRANNLYPAAWAIRSTHMPEFPPEVIG